MNRCASLTVTSSRGPVENLNELEYIKGEIYANVWLTDYIVRIDPETGRVTGWIDLRGLLPRETIRGVVVDVLNGIAYDYEQDRLFVTGNSGRLSSKSGWSRWKPGRIHESSLGMLRFRCDIILRSRFPMPLVRGPGISGKSG